jgi:hypothetical protein
MKRRKRLLSGLGGLLRFLGVLTPGKRETLLLRLGILFVESNGNIPLGNLDGRLGAGGAGGDRSLGSDLACLLDIRSSLRDSGTLFIDDLVLLLALDAAASAEQRAMTVTMVLRI